MLHGGQYGAVVDTTVSRLAPFRRSCSSRRRWGLSARAQVMPVPAGGWRQRLAD